MKRIRIIAIISAVVTALAVYLYLESLKKPPEVKLFPVVVASVQIAEGQEITSTMVAVKMLPADAIVTNAATNTDEVVGRVSGAMVEPGEQMLVSRFFKAGEAKNGLAEALEKGKRAFTLAVDTVSGVAGLLKPRDNVDVLLIISVTWTSTPDPANANPAAQQSTSVTETFSKILLQNIRVLATGQTIVPGGGDAKEAVAYDTVTLSLTPEQAVQLNLADAQGKIRLILRSPIDSETPTVKEFEVADLVDAKSPLD